MNKPGRLLTEKEANPIESNDHKALGEVGGSFKNAFQGHCRVCEHRTGNKAALSLMEKFSGLEDSDEAWQALSDIYIQHEYDVLNETNLFEVYEQGGEPHQLSYPLALELVEESLNAACGKTQDSLMIEDGFEASIYFSDDEFKVLLLPYILREFKNSELPWHNMKGTFFDDEMSAAQVAELFAQCIVPFEEFGTYYAVINKELYCCPMGSNGLPDLNAISGVIDYYPSVTKAVNAHFGTDFQPNIEDSH